MATTGLLVVSTHVCGGVASMAHELDFNLPV